MVMFKHIENPKNNWNMKTNQGIVNIVASIFLGNLSEEKPQLSSVLVHAEQNIFTKLRKMY
jgi:hypothetical protein